MRQAMEVTLTEDDRKELEAIAQSRRSEVRNSIRAKIVLMAADGAQNKEIAKELRACYPTVLLWRNRFAEHGMVGLKEKPGRGRKRTYDTSVVEKIIDLTLHSTPKNETHWSIRTMAKVTGVSHTTVRRIWNAHNIKPHLVKTFKLSNDKRFVEKLRNVVGLYLNPPEHAIVLCVDEKTQIQALDRTQPSLPLKKGRCGTMTHDYKRNGTTTLFAALNVMDGTIIGSCTKRHRHQEYLKFLKKIDLEIPKDLELHLIVDNYSTHFHHKVKQWLEKHPRIHVHFIPTSSSWLNLVERFFGEITSKRIRRGVFRSVEELTEAIYAYLEQNNADPKPFVWTKTADEIIQKLLPIYKELGKELVMEV